MAIFFKKSKRFVSYNPKNRLKHKILSLIRFIILFFAVYEIISILFISSFSINSISMFPQFSEGDKILASPLIYGAKIPFSNYRIPGFSTPERGDLILSRPAYFKQDPWYIRILDPVVRFFTFQKKTISPSSEKYWETNIILKRVAAIPGDTIKMENSILYIKPKGENKFVSEFEVSSKEYSLQNNPVPKGWDNSLPFSGNFDEITLKKDTFFLLGDNRNFSNDSRYWGAVPRSMIISKVILRYWPKIDKL